MRKFFLVKHFIRDNPLSANNADVDLPPVTEFYPDVTLPMDDHTLHRAPPQALVKGGEDFVMLRYVRKESLNLGTLNRPGLDFAGDFVQPGLDALKPLSQLAVLFVRCRVIASPRLFLYAVFDERI